MKKSLLALVVLGAFAGGAFAQSSVTIYGKIDQAFGKPIGTKDRQVADTANQSRIGFRGYEDLGGGLAGIFLLEHRFAPDTGEATSTTKFWQGNSYVGLKSNFGTVTLGRQYTSSYQNVRNQIDPFQGESLAALREIGGAGSLGQGGTAAANPGSVGQTRIENSVKYSHTMYGVTLSADIGERNQPTPSPVLGANPNRPWSAAVSYANGPLWAGVSYEDPQNTNDDLVNLGARYKFGPATVSLGLATGHNALDAKVNSALGGLVYSIGAGDIKLGYAFLRTKAAGTGNWVTQNSRWGVGYNYNLSKRTKLFVDAARDSRGAGAFNAAGTLARTEKNAYDVGIQHNF